MTEDINATQSASSLKDLHERSPYGESLKQVMSFFVPLALRLPALRDNSNFLQEEIKTTDPRTGLTDVATAADIDTQRQLEEHAAEFGWGFWGEEGEDRITELDPQKPLTLVADPIEGTNNFKRRIDDQWGSVVALVDNETGEPVIGIVAHPNERRFYVGVKGGGAHVLDYDEKGQLISFTPLSTAPEKPEFTYNNSPHFNEELASRVTRFHALGLVRETDNLGRSKVQIDESEFVDPESGALEAVQYRGTIYFKTGAEMAAVFTILNELGGKVTDGSENPWSVGINTLIAARTPEDHAWLKKLYDKTENHV